MGFEIIKYCFENGKPPIPQSMTPSQDDTALSYKTSDHYGTPLDISKIRIRTNKYLLTKTESIYRKQCPILYKGAEDVLKKCFSISIANNYYPFLINLVDSYLRDKALYFQTHKDKNADLQVAKWRNKSKYFQKIKKKDKENADL